VEGAGIQAEGADILWEGVYFLAEGACFQAEGADILREGVYVLAEGLHSKLKGSIRYVCLHIPVQYGSRRLGIFYYKVVNKNSFISSGLTCC